MKEILVFGWYGDTIDNLGDNLFKVVFSRLFPDYKFKYTNYIDKKLAQYFEIFFFGGGSFLDGEPHISKEAIEIISNKSIFYIGVGTETFISPIHTHLLNRAKLIATRTVDTRNLKKHTNNTNILVIPDLVYAIENKHKVSKRNNSIAFIPNFSLVSNISSPSYKSTAWAYFKQQVAETLDCLIDNNTNIDFFSMNSTRGQEDAHAAIEIKNQMLQRERVEFIEHSSSFEENLEILSYYKLIITQRYHGIILAEITETPYVIISHHDKLQLHQPLQGSLIDYYGLNKNLLLQEIKQAQSKSVVNEAINTNIFERLISQVNSLLPTDVSDAKICWDQR